MRAVILAAGRGTRLGTLSDDRPKCLVELANKPLFQRQIAALQGGGISTIGVVRGYRGEMLNFPGLTCVENPRWSETNMVMSLAAAADWLSSGKTIVSYGDIFYASAVVRDLASAPGDLVVAYDRRWQALWARRFADPLSDAETFQTDASGRLTDIGRRTNQIDEIQGQYMGLLKFTPAAWRAVERILASVDPSTRDRMDMTTLLRRLLESDFSIQTVGTSAPWGEVDSLSDLQLYEKMICDGELYLEN